MNLKVAVIVEPDYPAAARRENCRAMRLGEAGPNARSDAVDRFLLVGTCHLQIADI